MRRFAKLVVVDDDAGIEFLLAPAESRKMCIDLVGDERFGPARA